MWEMILPEIKFLFWTHNLERNKIDMSPNFSINPKNAPITFDLSLYASITF